MIQKVNLENLYVLKDTDLMRTAKDNYKMSFAVTKVVQLVVDAENRLIGILPEIRGEEKDALPVTEYMMRSFVSLIGEEGCGEEAIADVFVGTAAETNPYYLIPVTDEDGHLLYAWQSCNGGVTGYKKAAVPRINPEQMRATVVRRKKDYPGRNIYVCSDCGELPESINIEDIKRLEKDAVVIVAFDYDYLAIEAVEECMRCGISYLGWVFNHHQWITNYFRIDPAAKSTFEELIQENGKYFDWIDFQEIFQALRQTERLEGCYVEIGTFRGDSAKAALEYMKQAGIERECYFLDTYEGFTYSEAGDSVDAHWAGTHTNTSIELVRERLNKYQNARCMRVNAISDELPQEIGKIAVCNVDVDMYEAYEAALEKVRGKMVKGGIILAEDFGHTPGLIGGQTAILKFARKYQDEFTAIYGCGSQLLLIKK